MRFNDNESAEEAEEQDSLKGPSKFVRTGSRFVRRLIPTVAAVSLTMGACVPRDRDDDDDDDDSNDNFSQQVTKQDFRNFCQAYEDCSPTAFEDYWGTVRDCVRNVDYYIGYYIDDYYPNASDACEAAYESVQFCYYLAEPRCTPMGFQYGLDDCSQEAQQMDQACNGNNSGNNNGGGGGGLGGL